MASETATHVFPAAERVLYDRNPLEEVICQLRFPPILRIASEVPALFQEAIRREFPLYSEDEAIAGLPANLSAELASLLKSNLAGGAETTRRFGSPDGWSVSLTSEFIALSTTKYTRWEDFRSRLRLPLKALVDVYSPAFFSRVGLRYRDVIRRSALGLESVPWSELLKPQIAAELSDSGLTILEAKHQVVVSLGVNRSVRMVHGLRRPTGDPEGEQSYALDSDFSRRSERRSVMQKVFLQTSTEKRDVYSPGALPTVSMLPCTHEPFRLWTQASAESPMTLLIERDFWGGNEPSEMATSGYTTVYAPMEDLKSARLRALCHLVVAAMPARALGELTNNIASLWEYYSHPISLPSPQQHTRRTAGVIRQRVERPAFHVGDE